MSKKEKFIEEVQKMIDETTHEWESNEAKEYWDAFIGEKVVDKPAFTDNGKMILEFMKGAFPATEQFKAKEIAEQLGVSSRSVSGAIRKLVTDGYVEKLGQDPILYALTDAGKEIEIS